jgi:hypothetical protein
MAMCFIAANVMAQDIKTEVILAGNLSYLNNVIEAEHIAHLSRNDLRILKNTILAKYGYIFAEADLKNHFSAFPWYNGSKSEVQKELTTTDLINAATIQSLENSGETRYRSTGSLGERLIISEKIYPLKNNSGDPGDANIGGEIVALVNQVEITRVRIIDNEFHLSLNEVPPGLLEDWKGRYDRVVQFSDPETKIASLSLQITGTELDIRRSSYNDNKDPLLRRYYLDEKRPGMKVENNYHYDDYFFYMYVDRDTFMRGVDHDEDPGQGKVIHNVRLKKGWNKIIHYRAEMNGFVRWRNAHIFEATVEKGRFEIYYFDYEDYLNDERVQFATLEGRVVVEKNKDGEDEFWFLLADPIRVRKDSAEKASDVYKILLWVDPEKFPRSGNYVLFGEIERWLTHDGDVIFSILEIKETK